MRRDGHRRNARQAACDLLKLMFKLNFVRRPTYPAVLAVLLAACGDNLAGPEPSGDDDPMPAPTAAPTAAILAPLPDATLDAATVEVVVKVVAEAGLASVVVRAGDAIATIDPATIGANGEAKVSLTLADGDVNLALAAIDHELRTAEASAAIHVDTAAPTFAVGAPRVEAVETRRLLFAQLHDATGIASAAYKVNGGPEVAIDFEGAPTDLTIREALPLVAGPNIVTLIATDGVGHERQQVIAFRYGLVTTGGGAHSGAIVDGHLLTWGRYNQGQLGLGGELGDDKSRLSPVPVPAFGAAATEVSAIAFNQNQSAAIRSDGTLWTWGANGTGQLGQGDLVQLAVPTRVPTLTDVAYVHVGYSHMLALGADGKIWAWGSNAFGQVGGAAATQLAPVEVTGIPSPVVELAAGSNHSSALTVDGHVYVWGTNKYGNLAIGSDDGTAHPTPALVADVDDVIDIASGRDHIVALRGDGTVLAWGLGASGQLGDGQAATATTPTTVVDAAGVAITGVRAVFANGNTSYAIVDVAGAQQYWGWGQNALGQLATNDKLDQRNPRRAVVHTPGETPVYLDTLVSLTAIGNGATHTILRTSTGAIWTWGWSFLGSLGVPTLTSSWAQTIPLEVTLPAIP